eukprot:s2958_g1.t3
MTSHAPSTVPPVPLVPPVPQRERVFAFRAFVLRCFGAATFETGAPVLDVAGGKGDLSWLLKNADGLDAIVVDPRVTDHTKITRTAMWHYQTRHEDVTTIAASRGPQGPLRQLDLQPPFRQPRHLRASQKAEETGRCGHHQSLELERAEGVPRALRIEDATEALEAIRSCGLILGFHPDQATETCIDLALQLRRPFAVCPCCVFPKEFPERKLRGRTVDIGWRVLMQSWLETAPERLQECGEQLRTLFEANVDQCWEMCQRKIKTPVPVTQNWLVCSLLKLLLALLRIELPLDPEKDAKDLPMKEKEVKVENMFWLALVWSFGATTDTPGRKLMDKFIRSIQQGMPVKDEFNLIADDPTMRLGAVPVSKTPFPEKDSIYEYFAFSQSNKWEAIAGFDIPKEALAHQVMVPTTDTVRSAFLLQTLVASEYHVLYSGLTGTGKTVVIQQELLKRFDKDKYSVISFAFSAQTNANQTQDIIDGKLDKRKKGTFGPPFGKRCLLFIDDMNMPAKEKYDAQPPIELLRQWMDASGWYDRKSAEFRNLVDLIFIGAMGPPGAGRPFMTGRYQRHFNLVFVTPFEQESLQRIFQSIMQWFLGRFPGAVAGVANAVVKSTIQLYEDMSAEMLPTPAKSHYTFNLRDLAKVHLGICRCQKKSMEQADDLARCWAHEAHRVFYDRLVTKEDQQWFQAKISEILKENFKKDWKSLVKVEPLIWCDFLDPKASYYHQVEDPPQLVEVLNNFLAEYNTMAKRGMELVLFMAAAQHVSQMVRVLKTPLGNALLVGVGGSGRKSLATLAAFVAEQETFQIEITKSYGMNDWHEDIKRLLIRCGGQAKEVCFLLPDTQIANENFVEEVSGLLNTGEVPNLFNAEEQRR